MTKQTGTPESLPITLQETKDRLKVTGSQTDADIMALMETATIRAEEICQRPFINRQYTETMPNFRYEINLDKVEVQSIDAITYLDTDGVEQTLAPDQYSYDLGGKFERARICPSIGVSWPSTAVDYNAVSIIYTAGYGADWNSVPPTVRTAILYLVDHYFYNRGAVGDKMEEVPETINHLLSSERIISL